ncbi:MAG: acyl-CoA thioesterase [Ardenticatenaceae bacterium]|nr:acyl-CoA thioesterase [Ardenticatenaceae bacterium]HBY93039.1 thioesterase [Chloroflexota bacterium]
MTSALSHEITFRVRYAETDQMGIVHHSVYFIWFEEARSDFMRARGSSYAEFERAGLLLPLSGASARFLAPARYDQPVTVRVWVERLRSRTLTFGYEVRAAQSGQTLVTGSTTHIVTTRDGQVTTWPPEWRAKLLGPV